MSETLAERFKRARNEKRLTQQQVADAAQVSKSAVSQIESGDTASIKSENLYPFARVLNVRAEWLVNGQPPMRYENEAELGPQAGRTRGVPIVGRAMLGETGYFVEEDYPAGQGDGFIDHPTKDANAYCLRVVGNSMAPAIKHGWFVAVEPNAACVVGEYVHILTRSGQHMVKTLLYERENEVTVLSVNDDRRLTIALEEVEFIRYVGGVYPPSKRRM